MDYDPKVSRLVFRAMRDLSFDIVKGRSFDVDYRLLPDDKILTFV